MEDVDLQLEPTPEASGEARRLIRQRLSDALPATTLHDIQVIVTELVTNSVKYGPGGPIEVSVSVLPQGLVRGEVCDPGTSEVGPSIRESGSPEGALGLRIVDALADRWAAENDDGTRVWFEVGLPGVA